jgi:hypothetical protein
MSGQPSEPWRFLVKQIFDRLHVYDKIRFPISLICVVVGLITWSSRPGFEPAQFPPHGESFQQDNEVIELGDRSDLCLALRERNYYLLISGSIDLTKIGVDQGFFQTADEENGIYFDIDSGGQVRLGIHLHDGTTGQVLFRRVRRTGLFNYAILIGANSSIRIVDNENDIQIQLKDIEPACLNTRIGAGNEMDIRGALVEANISTGSDIAIANEFVENYVSAYDKSLPSTLYKWPLYTGMLLLAVGNPLRWRKK